jgi:hypothetical protein
MSETRYLELLAKLGGTEMTTQERQTWERLRAEQAAKYDAIKALRDAGKHAEAAALEQAS